MSLNSAHAFSYAISGSFTEESINKYAAYVNNTTAKLQQMGGWLGQQAINTMKGFDSFLNSRAWEMSKRLLSKEDGEYVGRFDIGYLGSISALQGADGYMRDYIMAHEGLMTDFLAEEIEGYDGDFSNFCKGVGEENLFFRRAMNGLLNLRTVDEKAELRRTHYNDSLGGRLSFRERVDVQKTWAAIDHHRANTMFDLTSSTGKRVSSWVDPDETPTEE